MPTPAKAMDNSSKHRTKTEIATREAAEASASPSRDRVRLRKPALIRSDKEACRYWDTILREVKGSGAELLDNLDSEIFAGYCSMLAMRDRVAMVTPELMRTVERMVEHGHKGGGDVAESTDLLHEAGGLLKTCSQLSEKRGKLDNTILSYAEKLGLTPSGRARLAVKRAQAEEQDELDLLMDGGERFG